MAGPALNSAMLRLPTETQLVGHRILVYRELDSTNNRALSASGDGVVIVADYQSAGRGRHGRTWHSAPGLGLWFSVGLDGPLPGLGFAAALAVRDALASHASLRVKWPNDLLLNGKKICGILVEYRQGRTALGIGINLFHDASDIPEDLRERASSILRETGLRLERSEVLKDVLEHLDRRTVALRRGQGRAILNEWRDACDIIGKRMRYQGAVGTVRGVSDAGALEVVADSGQTHWITADHTDFRTV